MDPLRVAHLSTYDLQGGAAIAAHRLHQGLLRKGVHSRMCVQAKTSDEASVTELAAFGKPLGKLKRKADSLWPKLYPARNRQALFSASRIPDPLLGGIGQLDADIVNLHWVCNGFYSVEALTVRSRPHVWTLHDMWPFTGGCHYAGACTNYEGQCGACWILGSEDPHDLSRSVWDRKKRAGFGDSLTVVCPSRWLAECAKKSSLMGSARIEVIPNGVDLDIFRPWPQPEARAELGLPLDKKLILFGSADALSDRRKGFQHFREALRALKDSGEAADFHLMVFGAEAGASPGLPLPATYLGSIKQESALAKIYSACEVFVAPSEQDNLPNTVVESLACGTPVVAFRIGGMPDLIHSGENGYLAKPFDHADLAAGIREILTAGPRSQPMRAKARARAEADFSVMRMAERYRCLYRELLGKA